MQIISQPAGQGHFFLSVHLKVFSPSGFQTASAPLPDTNNNSHISIKLTSLFKIPKHPVIPCMLLTNNSPFLVNFFANLEVQQQQLGVGSTCNQLPSLMASSLNIYSSWLVTGQNQWLINADSNSLGTIPVLPSRKQPTNRLFFSTNWPLMQATLLANCHKQTHAPISLDQRNSRLFCYLCRAARFLCCSNWLPSVPTISGWLWKRNS